RDPALPEKLWAEAPGILNRLLAGCQAWQERGLDVPDIARAQVEDYQHEMDPLSEFFEDCCIIEEGKRVAKTDLFEAFCEWRAQRRGSTVSYRHFNRLMNERNFDGKGVTTIE